MNKTDAEKFVKEAGDDVEFEIRTKDEHKKYIENIENHAIANRTGKMHSQQEADIFEISGIPKEEAEKAYDYNKRVLKLFKEKAEAKKSGGSEEDKAKIKELEKKLEEKGDGDAGAVRKLLKEKEETWEKEKTGLQSEIKSSKVLGDVSKGLRKIELNPDLDKDILEVYLDNAKNALLKIADIRDGKVVYLDENNEPILNKKTAVVADSEYILREKLVKVIKVKKDAKGVGSGDTPKPDEMKLPDDVKTKDDLTKYLQKSGLKGKEKQEAYNKLSKLL